MFGILFFIFIALCGGAAAIKKVIDDVKIYPHTKSDFDGYYIDSVGHTRQLGTGNQVYVMADKYGDEIMYSTKSKMITNITKNQREKFIEAITNAIKNGETKQTAYWCDRREYHENEWSGIKGHRYKDAENGKIYIVRTFEVNGFKSKIHNYVSGMMETYIYKMDIHFFMDITNGHLIRKTDFTIRFDKEYPNREAADFVKENEKTIQNFIDDFNKKQDIDIQNKGIKGFEDHYFFNDNKWQDDSFLDMQWVRFKRNEGVLELEKEETPEVTWSH